MIELFKLYNINNTFTDRYRLQQNGIAEAFWKYIEHHYESEDDILDTILFYNDVKPHASLPSSIINGIHVSHNPGYEYDNSVEYNGIESRAFYNVSIQKFAFPILFHENRLLCNWIVILLDYSK